MLVEERKVAGILVERIETPTGPGSGRRASGINVSQTLDELPGGAGHLRSSSRPASRVDRTDLLGQVLGSLHGLQGLLARHRGAAAAYADVCSTLGREVDVHLPGDDVRRGEALDVDDRGALVVSTADGTFTVGAGDVVHVRPPPVT